MNDNLSPEERKYVEVYEQVSHEIQQKKDPEQIVRELMAEGYEEKDAAQWVTSVSAQIRNRMVQRSLFVLIPGVVMLLTGLVFRVAILTTGIFFGSTVFETWLIVFGAVLSVWGLCSWAKYRR
jgi:uncharacterized protein YoaH (UPF0181 family)